jgi:hypothetical protein
MELPRPRAQGMGAGGHPFMLIRDTFSCVVVLVVGVILALVMLIRSTPRTWREMEAEVVAYCETHETTAACRKFLAEHIHRPR